MKPKKPVTIILAVFFALMPMSGLGSGSDIVISKNNTRDFLVRIRPAQPHAPTMILQFFPPRGVTVVEAQPAQSKYDNKNHLYKWLLKGMKSGQTTTVRFITNKDLPLKNIKIQGFYRNPATKKMVELSGRTE